MIIEILELVDNDVFFRNSNDTKIYIRIGSRPEICTFQKSPSITVHNAVLRRFYEMGVVF